ncbi:unnamed protein product [Leptidea sinapis]|uniref:Phosphatidylinositol N-acetylglucosaminyltransferase subunit H conserved domain-containing protein n=1 Tax=Leptidea sinapis TaxID=189913 RepID=A0A5E4QDQ7_9NEOP|nr:unnamed protein product [Leptidea sinapis]
MYSEETIMNYKNVNGYYLTLKIEENHSSPNSQRYTISYKNEKISSSWGIASLLLAILFNLVAAIYLNITLIGVGVLIVVVLTLVFSWFTHSVQYESLLVIPTVGIQSSVKYVVGRVDNFIPWSSIDDIIINEVIEFYTKPRLKMLQAVYTQLQLRLMDAVQGMLQSGSGDKKID